MRYYPTTTTTTFLLGAVLLLSSCQAIIQSLYGMHNLRTIPVAELRDIAQGYGIPPNQVAVLDTSYRTFLRQAHHLDAAGAKNHYQPLQISYYDAQQLRVFYANCYAGGFPNLHWDRAGGLQQFPPASQAPLDALLPLPAYLRYLRTPAGQPLPIQTPADYTVIVQWSRFMGRQSQRLITQVQRNAQLALRQGQSVRLVFVNNDNLQAYLLEHQHPN